MAQVIRAASNLLWLAEGNTGYYIWRFSGTNPNYYSHFQPRPFCSNMRMETTKYSIRLGQDGHTYHHIHVKVVESPGAGCYFRFVGMQVK